MSVPGNLHPPPNRNGGGSGRKGGKTRQTAETGGRSRPFVRRGVRKAQGSRQGFGAGAGNRGRRGAAGGQGCGRDRRNSPSDRAGRAWIRRSPRPSGGGDDGARVSPSSGTGDAGVRGDGGLVSADCRGGPPFGSAPRPPHGGSDFRGRVRIG